MLRSVRKNIASAISKVEGADDFHYGSWLRSPPSDGIEFGTITSRLKDTSNIDYSFSEARSVAFRIGLEIIDEPPENRDYYFPKIKSNAIFFMMHTVASHGVDLKEIEPQPRGFKAKDVDFIIPLSTSKEIRVKFNLWDPKNYNFRLTEPVITDYLESMNTEVYNIDLLNIDELYSEKAVEIIKLKLDEFKKVKVKSHNISAVKKAKKIYKVKVPGMGEYESSQVEIKITKLQSPDIFESIVLSFPEVPSWSSNVKISHTTPYKYFDASDEKLIEMREFKVNELKDPTSVKDILKLILKNIQKVEWDKRKDSQFPLLPYEDEGARFLVESNSALLQDELGLDKVKETIAALKFLFGNRVIKSALIVCSPGAMRNVELSKKWNLELGWKGKLNKWCSEFPFIEVKGNDDERADCWRKSNLIHLADYETATNDFSLKILEPRTLKRFDCIILDEAQNILNKGEREKTFLQNLNPATLWALTSSVNRDIQNDLNKELKTEALIESVKLRRKKELKDKAPKFIWHEEWLNLDSDQEREYRETMVDCQKELRRILESGNPYRFQANIFTLLHRLKQVCNFAPGNTTSPKTDLLLDQVLTIRNNSRKVLILSQYDRLGTKKIEKLLDQNGIKSILAPQGTSADEMKRMISTFGEKQNITAFITDAKISRLSFGNSIVPYIIKFDQWWNPVNLWEIEDIFELDNVTQGGTNINLYAYNILNTIDDHVKSLLTEKGYMEKNVIEMIPAKVLDELISVDEWLKMFGMPVSEEERKEISPKKVLEFLNKSTLNYFRTTLSKFFFKLGYKNLDIIDEPGTSSFNVIGESKRNSKNINLFAKIVLEDIVSVKEVKEVILQSASSNDNKVFVITKGKFRSGCERYIKENVTLLDGIAFSEYLVRFNLLEQQEANASIDWVK